jgi:regulator of sigma E protease
MAFIIFIIILSILVFVHEMGHFIAAKKAGVRVDEFGFGFPPRMLKLFSKGGTDFTLNWIPFGGFVKIFGENYTESEEGRPGLGSGRHFTEVSKLWQVVILAAGVTFNFLLAWVFIALGFMIGLPYSVDNELGARVQNPALMIVAVLPESPAFEAGIKSGDIITSISRDRESITDSSQINPGSVSEFIGKSSDSVNLDIKRGDQMLDFEIMPSENVVSGRYALGISMDTVGTLKLPIHLALYEGIKTSVTLLVETVKGIGALIFNAFRGTADLSQVAGPVGIVGIVGEASELGFIYLLTLTAFISINLAVINLVPFPSLDGGRILFVIVEALKGSPVNPKFFNWANMLGFALLIIFMVLITVRDVGNLF